MTADRCGEARPAERTVDGGEKLRPTGCAVDCGEEARPAQTSACSKNGVTYTRNRSPEGESACAYFCGALPVIDTHCHLSDERYPDKGAVVDEYLASGVGIAVNAGYDMASSKAGAVLSKTYPSVFFTVGVHPDNAENATEENMKILADLSRDEKCLAVGEIGLDFHYTPYDEEAQKRAFSRQILLAKEVGLPFAVHMRDATKETVDLLSAHKNDFSAAVMHCYSGSVETAKILLDLGMYFSFSGTLTFKNARGLKEVARFLPEDRILTETDSPYLAPEPYRGKENRPAYVCRVLEALAEIRGENVRKTAERVFKNARTVFPKLDRFLSGQGRI